MHILALLALSLLPSAAPQRFVNLKSGLCLEVAGSSTAAGARIQVNACSTSSSQRWDAMRVLSGGVRLGSASGCVDIAGGNPNNGTALVQWPCKNGSSADNQTFELVALRDSLFALRAPSSGRCLEVSWGATAPGTPAQMWDCNGSGAQIWAPIAADLDDGASRPIANAATAKCLDAQSSGTANFTPVQQWECTQASNQNFTFRYVGIDERGRGYYNLVHQRSGRCLDVSGISMDAGAQIWLYDCLGTQQLNQQWHPEPSTGEAYGLRVRHSGQMLDLYATDARNGARIQQYYQDDLPAQSWRIVGLASSTPTRRGPKVGVYYSGWHTFASQAADQMVARGRGLRTVEQVLRSAGGMTYNDIWVNDGLEATANNFYYQYTPRFGYYCLVSPRQPGSVNYDPSHESATAAYACPMAAATLKRQAQMLTAAGIDYVVFDATNSEVNDAYDDIISLRPFEVLLTQWSALRAQGISTPQVAIWQRLPAPGANPQDSRPWMIKAAQAVYANPAWQDLLLRDGKTGKKILFYSALTPYASSFVNTLNTADTVAVGLGAYSTPNDTWSYMSPCQQGARLDDGPCNQHLTRASPVGSQMSVMASYQLTYASLPFQASGIYGGQVLRKQWASALAAQPDHILLGRWNEQIAQAQPGIGQPSMGLEGDRTAGTRAFVDLYGTEYSGDLEGSQELGSLLYDITASCIRVLRLGSTTCDRPGELCCQGGAFSATYGFYDGAQGTFGLYTQSRDNDGRVALYACDNGGDTFLSPASNCEGTRVVRKLGYVAPRRGGETLRALLRCFGSGGHAYALGGACPAGTRAEAVLGYVR